MSNRMNSYRAFVCLIATFAMVQIGDVAAQDNEIASGSGAAPAYSYPTVEIGGYVAEDGGSGSINAILPLAMQGSHALLFLGADATMFGANPDSGGFDAAPYNVGAYIGYRSQIGDGAGVLGLWAGADTMRTQYGNSYQRLIVGAEYFGSRLIARVSGFVPFDGESAQWSEAVIVGGIPVEASYVEETPAGIDAEVGLRFEMPALPEVDRPGELRIFAGAYNYSGLAEDGDDVAGGRGRIELDLYPIQSAPETRLTFELSYSGDSFHGGNVSGGVRLSIPLGDQSAAHMAVAESANFGQSGGSLKDDPGDAKARSYSAAGKDLFQPVRRNNRPISIRRTTGPTGYTLATVCGGPGVPIPLSTIADGDAIPMDPVVQGQEIGIYEPSGSLFLDIGTWTDGSGQTLAQLLAGAPATINTTVTIPANSVPFFISPTLSIPGYTQAEIAGTEFGNAILIINNGTCSLEFEAMAAAAASDSRLKRDVELLMTLANGTKIYSFRYINSFDPSGRTFVGVMAQELLTERPDAVIIAKNGYYAVNYRRLGLRMATLDEWQKFGFRALVPNGIRPPRQAEMF